MKPNPQKHQLPPFHPLPNEFTADGCTFHLLDRAGNVAVYRNRKHKHVMYEVMVIDDQDNLSSIQAFKSFAEALSKMDTLYAEQSNKAAA
jgi:hypothetical protein